MQLHRLIYLSHSKKRLSDAKLDRMLIGARMRNDRMGITGMLVYAGQTFLQIIEGPREVVIKTADRIYSDPAHFKMKVIYSKDVDSRLFPDFSMGFRQITPHCVNSNAFFELTQHSLEEHIPPCATKRIQDLIHSFADTKLPPDQGAA